MRMSLLANFLRGIEMYYMNNYSRGIVFVAAALLSGTVFAQHAMSSEVMTDRCSAEVAIVPYYDARPDTPGTIILKRRSDQRTDWTPAAHVQLGSSGHIRWWCHSTTGNMFDPGTWRIKEVTIGTKCAIYPDGTPENCRPDGTLKVGSSAWSGWTPERSRCDDRSTNIRARLGPDRLLQIECLGR